MTPAAGDASAVRPRVPRDRAGGPPAAGHTPGGQRGRRACPCAMLATFIQNFKYNNVRRFFLKRQRQSL